MNHPRFITTRSGVRIGSAWTPPAPRPTADQEQMQRALLERRTRHPRPLFARFIGAIVRWL